MLVRIVLFWYTKQIMCVKGRPACLLFFYVSITGLDKEEPNVNYILCMSMIFLIIYLGVKLDAK